MKTALLTMAALALALPAHAQVSHSDMEHGDMDHAQMDHAQMDHAQMDHAQMDHAQMDHGDMDHGSMEHGDHAGHDHAAPADPHAGHGMAEGVLALSRTAEIDSALASGGEPVVVKVLGAVCDFCATAMNKTFGRRDDVAAVHVDLDAKTLNLVLEPGAELTDKTLRKLVKKSGYKADTIVRGPQLAG